MSPIPPIQKSVLVLVAMANCACQSIPQAGMLYSQHTVGGLEIAVGDTSTTTSPAHIQIGYKNDFGTYIPMAALLEDKSKSELVKLMASADLLKALADQKPELKTSLGVQDFLTKTGDAPLLDVISVYSSFESAFKAQTQTPSGEVSAGNVFATGFAARELVRAKLLAHCARIKELLDATDSKETEKKQALEAIWKAQCVRPV